MQKIDAHIHYRADHPDALALFDEFNLKLLNVCVAHDSSGRWRQERAVLYRQFADEDPQRFAWCTTFDPPGFDGAALAAAAFAAADYADRVIEGLARDFAAGAVACKFWKNIGMKVHKPDGSFLMIDDPIFTPIYAYLAAEGKPALMHIAEPLACWQPLDDTNAHYGYYSQHPEWHMFTKPEFPSHQALMDARDHMLAQNPSLRVIGAHLGSLEYDVAEIARRLDRYPNFAVDTSARLKDLALQDSAVVRQFFLDYQDRILFGTDIVQGQSVAAMDEETRARHIASIRQKYAQEFAYYETADTITIQNREVQGLELPEDVSQRLYYDNVLAWYPGIEKTS